jgi:hypothetical protein
MKYFESEQRIGQLAKIKEGHFVLKIGTESCILFSYDAEKPVLTLFTDIRFPKSQ